MTPTREQLEQAIDAIMADLRGRSGVLDGVDRDVQDEMRSELVGVLAAALAPQEAAPMPPIEKGDVVEFDNGRLLPITLPEWPDVPREHWPESLVAIYKPVWTREPRP